MKRIIITLFLAALFCSTNSTVANGAGAGVKIEGNCTVTGGPIASSQELNTMQTQIAEAITKMNSDIMSVLKQQTGAMQTSQASQFQAEEQAANTRLAAELNAQEKINSSRNMINLPDQGCCSPDPNYYYAKTREQIEKANGLLAARDRNIGLGISENQSEAEKVFANLAKTVLKEGTVLTGRNFTDEQYSAWNDLSQLMFGTPKNKRTSGFGHGQNNRYDIGEAQSSEMRMLLLEPWRRYGLDRQMGTPSEELLQFAGANIDRPALFTASADSKGFINPLAVKAEPIKEGEKISYLSLMDLINSAFMSDDYLNKVGAKDTKAVAFSQLKMMGYEMGALMDIREQLMLNNLYMSMLLIPQYQDLNSKILKMN